MAEISPRAFQKLSEGMLRVSKALKNFWDHAEALLRRLCEILYVLLKACGQSRGLYGQWTMFMLNDAWEIAEGWARK